MQTGSIVVGQRFFLEFLTNLYQEQDAFIRELLSNSHAAIMRRAMGDPAGFGDNQPVPPKAAIDLRVNQVEKIIEIADNGVGMREKEMVEVLSQLGVSLTEQFRSDQNLRMSDLSEQQKEQLLQQIGYWGIGIYSGLTVANEIEFTSRAAGSEESFRWICGRDSQWKIAKGPDREVGTSVILRGVENADFLNEDHLRESVVKYADFFPYPVRIGGVTVNQRLVPWDQGSPGDATLSEFYRSRYPGAERPLAMDFLEVDSMKHNLSVRGVFYIASHPTNEGLTLLVQRVPVVERIVLLPNWAERMMCGVIETDLPLNPNRELPKQSSEEIRNLKEVLRTRCLKFLSRLVDQPQTHRDVWQVHGDQLRSAALFDPHMRQKLGRSILLFPSSKREACSLNQYITRALGEDSPAETATIYYSTNQWAQASHVNALEREDKEVLFVEGTGGEQLLFAIEEVDTEKPKLQFRRVDEGPVDDEAQSGSLYQSIQESQAQSLTGFAKMALGDSVTEVLVASYSPEEEQARLVRPPLPEELRRFGPVLEEISKDFQKYQHVDRKKWPRPLREIVEEFEGRGQNFTELYQKEMMLINRRQLILNWENDQVKGLAEWVSNTTGSDAQRDSEILNTLFRMLLHTARVNSGEPLEEKDQQESRMITDGLLQHILSTRNLD